MSATVTRSRRPGLLASCVAIALLALAPTGAAAAKAKGPNDRAFPAQWQLTTDAAMGARSAWNVATAGNVVVAVVDTGAELRHPDLAANVWTNTGEIAGNGIDDDGNGFADDVHGWDFAGKDADPSDDNGHGTSVAGVIGARGNNGVGVTGVAWRAQLMIVKVLDAKGTGNVYDVARGIRYAVANGAKVVNLSMAGPDTAPALEDALADAQAAGVLVVAAAGNTGADLDTKPAYPAASAAGNVIAVASTDEDGHLASGSSFGAATVDLTAPGENIDSTELRGAYGLRSGTSQAAAHVSGVLALMAAAQPAATADQLRAQLLAGTRANGLPVATGGLDAGAALRGLLGLQAPRATKRKTAVRKAATRRAALRATGHAPAPLTLD